MRVLSATAAMSIGVAALSLVFAGCEQEVPERAPVVRPIKIMTIAGAGAGRVLEYSGQVEAGETADLSFEVPGRIVELLVVESQRVSQGELLARLDPADYESAVEQAEADFRAAETTFRRYEDLVGRGAVSQQDYDQRRRNMEVSRAALDTARKALRDTRLLAPFDGTIGRRLVDNFVNVLAKQSVLVIQDVRTLDVVVTVPEQDWGRARPGVSLEDRTAAVNPRVKLSSFPDQSFPASFKEVATVADPVTRTFSVRVNFPNPPDVTILPGMTANVAVTVPPSSDFEGGETAVMLPSSAVFADDDGNPRVWKVDSATMQVSSAPVEIGTLSGASIRVLSGVDPGDRIATSGVHNLREGMTVRELVN